jgi:hypothetical protein
VIVGVFEKRRASYGEVKFWLGTLALCAAIVFVAVPAVIRFEVDALSKDAKQLAARCLTETSCQRLDAKGALVTVRPPLERSSRCANAAAWAEVTSISQGYSPVVRCVDGAAYLYHLGGLRDGEGSRAQWLACRTVECSVEIASLKLRLIRGLWRTY